MNDLLQFIESMKKSTPGPEKTGPIYNLQRDFMSYKDLMEKQGLSSDLNSLGIKGSDSRHWLSLYVNTVKAVQKKIISSMSSIDDVISYINDVTRLSSFKVDIEDANMDSNNFMFCNSNVIPGRAYQTKLKGDELASHCKEKLMLLELSISDVSTNDSQRWDMKRSIKALCPINRKINKKYNGHIIRAARRYDLPYFVPLSIADFISGVLILTSIERFVKNELNDMIVAYNIADAIEKLLISSSVKFLPKNYRTSYYYEKVSFFFDEMEFTDDVDLLDKYDLCYKREPYLFDFFFNGPEHWCLAQIFPQSFSYTEENIVDGKSEILLSPKLTYSKVGKVVYCILTEILSKGYSLKSRYDEINAKPSSYAHPYQTKKNIPEKVIKKMKTSALNDFFNNVELDAETDLEKFSIVEKEMLDFLNVYGFDFLKTYALRFRRLRKFGASGKVYHLLNAMVVDFRQISSFVHEFFHVLDVEQSIYNPISDGHNFMLIANKYKELLTNNVHNLPDDHPFKNKFYSKRKHNKDYYFDNMEIFARCGQIFMYNILGKDSSLLAIEDSPAHPMDPDFVSMVTDYFYKLKPEWLTKDNKEAV